MLWGPSHTSAQGRTAAKSNVLQHHQQTLPSTYITMLPISRLACNVVDPATGRWRPIATVQVA